MFDKYLTSHFHTWQALVWQLRFAGGWLRCDRNSSHSSAVGSQKVRHPRGVRFFHWHTLGLEPPKFWFYFLQIRFPWYGGFLKWGYPQIIHFNRVFPYKPTIFGYLYLWKPPYWILYHHNSWDYHRNFSNCEKTDPQIIVAQSAWNPKWLHPVLNPRRFWWGWYF